MLGQSQATVANNVKLYSGELRYWRGATSEYTPLNIPVSMYKVYRSGSSAWLTFTSDTDVVPGPLADTTEIRLYYTSTAFAKPRKTNWALATTAAPYPSAYLNMGVPNPTAAPSVAYAAVGITGATVVNGGTGYAVGNTLTVTGGTGTAATLTVSAVSSGAITAVTVTTAGSYTAVPTNPVSVTGGAGTGATFTLTYPSIENRVYVYTYVSTFGTIKEESGPSPASSIVTAYSGVAVTVGSFTNAPTTAAGYNITALRIYRSISDGSGNANYAFVTEIAVTPATGIPAASSYSDSLAVTSLGSALPSLIWAPPPDGLQGLVAMANGILAGFVGNTVWFCEPYYPHAWPSNYSLTVPHNIIGLGTFGNMLLVATEKFPYVISGSVPGAMSQERLPLPEPCVSKRSIVSDEFGVTYASPNGLVAIGSGQRGIVTQKLFRRDEWQTYTPSTLQGAVYDGKYFGTFTSSNYTPNNQTMVLSRDDIPAMSYLNDTVKLQVGALHVDQLYGYLYYYSTVDQKIYKLDSDDNNPTTYDWQSKRFVFTHGETFSALKLDADFSTANSTNSYAAQVAVISAANALVSTSSWNAVVNAVPMDYYTVNGGALTNFPAPQTVRYVNITLTGDDGAVMAQLAVSTFDTVRIPPFRCREMTVRIQGNANVRGISLATTVPELRSG
jgi:hypothetical protein